MTVAAQLKTPVDVRHRTHLQRRLSQVMLVVFTVDLLVMVGASLLAWQIRGGLDKIWESPTSHAAVQPPAAPWLIGLWALVLLSMGAYDTREFGARFEEFRALVLGTVVTIGIVAAALCSQLSGP